MKMSRAKLEELVHDLVEKTMGPVQEALRDAKMKKEDVEEIVLVGGMTRMPLIQRKVEAFFGKKPNASVNPDEVVALGAAVHAGVLGGDVKDVLLLDVSPLSLGIETLGGVMTKLLEKNTTIPASKAQIFSTAADGQPQVEIHVLQGEREMAADNKTLGRFALTGIPPAPRGVPQIEVKFDIDANGILNVSATDKATGKSQQITITASTNLSDEEVEKMKKDAERHAVEDKQRRERIEHQNLADTMIYTAEKMLKEAGDKVSAAERKEVEEKIAALKSVKDGDDHERIKKAADDLSLSAQKVGAKMYQNAEGGSAGTAAGEDQKTVDAEFEEKPGSAGTEGEGK
jgi:molecular chaperone DnaK